MTPTPISSDIPNKVCVAQALAETDTENTAELSQAPTKGGKKKKVCAVGGVLGGEGEITAQKICDL